MMRTYIHYKTVGRTYMLGPLILDLPHLFWSNSRQDKLLWCAQIKYVNDKI